MGLDNFRIRQITPLEVPISPCGLCSRPGVTNWCSHPHSISWNPTTDVQLGLIVPEHRGHLGTVTKNKDVIFFLKFCQDTRFSLSSCQAATLRTNPFPAPQQKRCQDLSRPCSWPHLTGQRKMGVFPPTLPPLKKKNHWVFFRDYQRSICWYDSSYFRAVTTTKVINWDPTFFAVIVSKMNLMEKTTEYWVPKSQKGHQW